MASPVNVVQHQLHGGPISYQVMVVDEEIKVGPIVKQADTEKTVLEDIIRSDQALSH